MDKVMTSNEIRQKFLDFFQKRGHAVIPSASLIPENDPSVLFTTAGMQQFKPYYIGEKDALADFGSKNAVSVQKCVRTSDIDEVGDDTHLTFFEMLGNFSFGGYGREDAIKYAHEFITKELGLEISYVTIYEGSKNVPRDDESEKVWKELGVKKIKEEGSDVFWGPTGNSGPCGPTTEIYCKNADGQDVEIWNIVFNEYFCDGSREKLDKGEANLKKLDVLGIDTGMGLERLLTIVQKKKSVYDTDLFDSVIDLIKQNTHNTRSYNDRLARIVVDHLRSATIFIADGVLPLNKDRGYILRRITRRSIFYMGMLLLNRDIGTKIIEWYVDKYSNVYKNLNKEKINSVFREEEEKFHKTITEGKKEFDKGSDPFILFTTYGFPIELTTELAKEKGQKIDLEDFNKKMAEHQKLSQTASAGMFKGGLSDAGEETKKLHTATHLLRQALEDVLGEKILQKGSNITAERLRFDFTFSRKMTDDEQKKVEDIVNEKIQTKLPVNKVVMSKEEAEKTEAEHVFGTKYGDQVTIYYIGNSLETAYSKEFCGGPHVENTGELGHFKIIKEEAVSAGVRRIKAILE